MAEPIAIKITNLPQIRAAFNKAPQLMKISLTRAIPLSLKAIKDDEEMQYANLGIGVRSGRLLQSIRTGLDYRSGTLKGEVGPDTTNYSGLDIMAKSWHGIFHYSYFVHEGTKYMRKRPFLLNAVKSAQPEVDKLFVQAVDDVLNNIGKSI